jgi:hypothetical protein
MRKRRVQFWIYKPKPPVKLPDGCKYTMLVAWHKFDNYERYALSQITKIELNKLPFTLVSAVWKFLDAKENIIRYTRDSLEFPLQSYRKRILRAVNKEMRKRKRVRLRIKE